MNGMRCISMLFVALLLMSAWCAIAVAQDTDEAAVTTDEGDDLDFLFESMTNEEIQALVKKLKANRLKMERQQVAAELEADLLYDPDDVDAAVKALDDQCKETLRDNIDRICKAFAKADPRFAKAYKLYAEGKFKASAAAAKKIVDPNQANYLSVATHWIYAESLRRGGRGYDAVEVYQLILVNMPERISFAACAGISAGETYEELSRFRSAMTWYATAVNNYYLALDDDDVEKIAGKLEKYQDIYKDPIGAVATRMDTVHERLKKIDSGKETQETEKQIVAILEDLIKTLEENQGGSGKGESQEKDKRKNGKGKDGKGKDGKGKGEARGNKPSTGATESTLPVGETVRPHDLAKIHDTTDGDDWANMPPRQREKLRNLQRRALSERHRDIIKAYHKRIAREATK